MSTATRPSFELRPSPSPMPDGERAARMENPGFGRVFTEHMVLMRYAEGRGWHDGVLQPYGPLSMDPASSVLHYGQAIFEGFKAYHQTGGGVATFRPFENARRFNASARRLAMPELPEELFVEAADLLVRQDRAWVPAEPGCSLYLRPLMIASEAALGVRPSQEYLFLLLASPAGAYFQGGVRPVTVWVTEDYVRAAPGGTGSAKCAGNYAASLLAQRQALERGCDQVVWLDALERRFVEEMGGMNIYFVFEEGGRTVLRTPQLTGTLLPGITRASLLELARDLGIDAGEFRLSVEEWGQALAEGRMTEAFACGTAAVITPIGTVKGRQGTWTVNGGETGPVATRLREALLQLQHGSAPDRHGWMHRVC
ncbi:MAG: branched-chain amino acid aminotransferase [Acidobacteria bacterium]|nr:branched-chain amino acid aminotransferase [Acidobacteriota bacterium]